MKKLLVMAIAAALATGFSFAAFAQSGATNEVNTAHAHALMAKTAKSVAMAHTHLHHVINCLVGQSGAGFDASAGNPCKGQGNGALPDSASNQALHGKLQNALADAQAGLKSSSLGAVHQDAGKAATTLQGAASSDPKASSSW
jgi:hypothetical protein